MTQLDDPGLTQRFFGALFVHAAGMCRRLAGLETRVMRTRLEPIRIDSPVFISGMARSGSTILLEVLASTSVFASQRYCDYPPVWFPFWWAQLRSRLPLPEPQPVERAHGDGIEITPRSPEGFDEIFWMHFFRHRHLEGVDQVIDAGMSNPAFECFYQAHIRKLLLARWRPRYLAKGNYNIARLAYLQRLFPDARFVVPVRHPFEQVASLIRQDQRFSQMARARPAVARHLARCGHFEFGPQKRSECVADPAMAARIDDDFRRGDLVAGYARQWLLNYGYLTNLIAVNPTIAAATVILAHEDLCASPEESLARLASHCLLDQASTEQLQARWAGRLGVSSGKTNCLDDKARQIVADNCALVADRLGYRLT